MATSPEYPKTHTGEVEKIRKRLGLTPDEIAPKVGARGGAEILAYENDEDDLLVSILFGYAKLANIPVENLLHDERDLWLGASAELTSSGRDGRYVRVLGGECTLLGTPTF